MRSSGETWVSEKRALKPRGGGRGERNHLFPRPWERLAFCVSPWTHESPKNAGPGGQKRQLSQTFQRSGVRLAALHILTSKSRNLLLLLPQLTLWGLCPWQLDVAALQKELDKSQSVFSGNPSVWLKDLASYLNYKLQAPLSEPTLSQHTHGGFSQLPQAQTSSRKF